MQGEKNNWKGKKMNKCRKNIIGLKKLKVKIIKKRKEKKKKKEKKEEKLENSTELQKSNVDTEVL